MLNEEKSKGTTDNSALHIANLADAFLRHIEPRQSTFTASDIRFHLKAQTLETKQAVCQLMSQHSHVVRLEAKGDLFTTTSILQDEKRTVNLAKSIASNTSTERSLIAVLENPANLLNLHIYAGKAASWAVDKAISARTLRQDQKAALLYAAAEGHLKLIDGVAGAGKSYAMGAMREAFEASGYDVIGLAPTNMVAQDMTKEGFNAKTIHAALFSQAQNWSHNTVIIVDEAAMIDTKNLNDLLHFANEKGSKLVLVGDDRQLHSVERGGMFGELIRRFGAAEISGNARQKSPFHKKIAKQLANGEFDKAMRGLHFSKAFNISDTLDEARTALIEQWYINSRKAPERSRYAFAYTNKDVDLLNLGLREVERSLGRLKSDDVIIKTPKGELPIALGERLQVNANAPALKLYNSMCGSVEYVTQSTIDLRLDYGNLRSIPVQEFNSFSHAYAGTIFKAQGRTVDESLVLHTPHWHRQAAYVAMTRHKHDLQIFAAREKTPNMKRLIQQISREKLSKPAISFQQ